MNFFQKVAVKILGPSWKTSLAGYGQLFGVTVYQGYQLLSGKELNQHDIITLLVSGGVAVGFRFARDHGVNVPDSLSAKVQDKVVDAIDSKLTDLEKKTPSTVGNPPKTVTPVDTEKDPAVTVTDPETVVTGDATCFGLDYSGGKDSGDNGEGAWGAKTDNKEIIGVSLPEGVMISTFGFEGTWKDNAVKVGKYLGDNKIQVSVSRGGKTKLADVVDAGPARQYKGKLLHNALDMTYALSHYFETNGQAVVSYQIIKDGSPMIIKGWDRVDGCEIAQAGVA